MNRQRRNTAVGIVLGVLIALIPAGAHGATAAPIALFDFPCSSNSAVGNFRGIAGEADLAIGAPGDSLKAPLAAASAGSINVVYSSVAPVFANGLDPKVNPQFFSEGSPGISRPGVLPQNGDNFGFSLAAGDFNGDVRDDLAVGIPGKNSGAGVVMVLYGSASGLVAATSQTIKQGASGVGGVGQTGAEFGYALASADFNKDGVQDLAIGAPRYDIGSAKDAGSVNVIYGVRGKGLRTAGDGITGAPNQFSGQVGTASGSSTEQPKPEADDFFGAALAAGQLSDGQSPEDLAIGAPGEDVGRVADDGAVSVWHGAPKSGKNGLVTSGSVFMFPGSKSMPGGSQVGARFGCSLAMGDFNGDHLLGEGSGADQDLAIGAPGWKQGSATNAGAVWAVYNSGVATGVSAVNPGGIRPESAWHSPDLFTGDAPGTPGAATTDAHFGAALAAGNFDGNRTVDLAVGEPTEAVFGKTGAGSVRVIDGVNGAGLRAASTFHALAQSPDDLQNGCYLLNLLDSGCINPIGGPADYSPLYMVAEKDDHFGSTLAAGDFNNDGKADLSIGVPGEDYGEFANWITEEQAEIPTDLVGGVSISIDQQTDAGIVQIVNGPMPAPADPPATQDIINRIGTDRFGGLGEAIRGGLQSLPGGLFDDNQIEGPTGDQTWSNDLTGDGFGGGQG